MGILCTLTGVGCALTMALNVAPGADMTGVVVTGPAYVQDGDTLYIAAQSFRLYGIDAEELSEFNGPRAKYALKTLIGTSQVTCTTLGRSYNRLVARCTVSTPNGVVDLSQSMVNAGMALDCARYSHGAYKAGEPAGVRSRLKQKPYC